MEQIKIRFDLTFTYNRTNDTNMNEMGDLQELYYDLDNIVIRAHHGGGTFSDKVKEILDSPPQFKERKEAILKLFEGNYLKFENIANNYLEVSHIPIRASNANSQKNEWGFTFTIQSKVYTCFTILSDKTFVCCLEDNEIVFIKPEGNCKVFYIPGSKEGTTV